MEKPNQKPERNVQTQKNLKMEAKTLDLELVSVQLKSVAVLRSNDVRRRREVFVALRRLTNGELGRSRLNRSPFRNPKQSSLPNSNRTFRSPAAAMSCCMASMLPYHTATASALLTSMLSACPRSYGWSHEGREKTR